MLKVPIGFQEKVGMTNGILRKSVVRFYEDNLESRPYPVLPSGDEAWRLTCNLAGISQDCSG